MFEIQADLVGTIAGLSTASDMNDLRFLHHAERVAYISLRIGEVLDFHTDQKKELVLSALLHDIGVATTGEKLKLADLAPEQEFASLHCKRGYELLKATPIFAPLAQNVLEHHNYYNDGLRLIPAIIHLADRVEHLLKKDIYCLWQIEPITNYVQKEKGRLFHPQVVQAFLELAPIPSFWLDLENETYRSILRSKDELAHTLTLDQLEEIAWMYAILVDSRCPFTAVHSSGVTRIVELLSRNLGINSSKNRLLKVAALLHDIGKLAVPEAIIQHPGKLNDRQMALMKQHTYHTYYLIGSIGQGIEPVQRWAAYHHERLDGSGYPFALKAHELELEARLIAIADVTQAITEDRPYRKGLPKPAVEKILFSETKEGRLDPDLVSITIDSLNEIMYFQ